MTLAGVFLSHASADRVLVDEIADLLQLGSQVPKERLFYTSGAGTGVPTGTPFNTYINERVREAAIVLTILTPAFQESAFCMAEAGAAWALHSNFFPVAVPTLNRSQLTGVFHGAQVRYLDDSEALGELHDRVCKALGLTTNTEAWERYRARFISRLDPILAELQSVSSRENELRVSITAALRKSLRTSSGGDSLFTFDDPGVLTFPQLVVGSDTVYILSRTAVNVLGHYERVFRDLLENGCEVRLIMLDDASAAAGTVYGHSDAIYRRNHEAALAHVNRLDKFLAHGQLRIRLCSESPPFSMVIAQRTPRAESKVNIQLNMLYSRVGRDRPVMLLNGADRWYDCFQEEFMEIWRRARDWSLDA